MTPICGRCESKKVQRPNGRWRCRACDAAYQRTQYAQAPDKRRESSRLSMRKRRAKPERREADNAKRRGNVRHLAKGREYNRTLREHRFFAWRARLLNRSGPNVTALELARLWKAQRGTCALSGRRLGRDAHLDHITPRSHGGSTSIANLRWLDPWVNIARQNLSDEEFRAGCAQVAEFIGRLIVEADEAQRAA